MRDPRTYVWWQWDDGNEPKLARRRIRRVDVEHVASSNPDWRRNKRAGTADLFMVGYDLGGRLLRVNVVWADEQRGILRAIGAWEVPAKRSRRGR